MRLFGIILLILMTFPQSAYTETAESQSLISGVEADALYYFTGGYHGGLWAGYNHLRLKISAGKYNWPDRFNSNGWQDQEGVGYGLYLGYFQNRSITGIALEIGLEYWIDELNKPESVGLVERTYNAAVLNIGYLWKFHKHLYIHPSVVLSYSFGFDLEYQNDYTGKQDNRLYPGASLIVGWCIF